ncbi:MAG: hypothetical protein U5J63_16535 [Fodinibius sp.]|nr:hypothetical protein [Fodinibius sp.]
MNSSPTHILKFGGSSLQTPDLIRQAAELVSTRTNTADPVVVVSAIGGVTDQLIKLADNHSGDTDEARNEVLQLRRQHLEYFDALISPTHPNRKQLDTLFDELQSTFENSDFHSHKPHAWKDQLLSVGERASALIFATLLSYWDFPADPQEAQHLIKTDSSFGRAQVNLTPTQNRIRQLVGSADTTPVITGFIGSNADQQITTLGRSAFSDFYLPEASCAGALECRKAGDMDRRRRVLQPIPKWVPDAETIPKLSFTDISELSAHGANVIHPQTIRPLQDKETVVVVKNSHNPVHPGTHISGGLNANGALKTITIAGTVCCDCHGDESPCSAAAAKTTGLVDGHGAR